MTCNRLVVFSGSLVSFTNKTDPQDITEIVLKVTLNTITHNQIGNLNSSIIFLMMLIINVLYTSKFCTTPDCSLNCSSSWSCSLIIMACLNAKRTFSVLSSIHFYMKNKINRKWINTQSKNTSHGKQKVNNICKT